jgi:hypothetical protein
MCEYAHASVIRPGRQGRIGGEMTSDRAQHYAALMTFLRDIGPAKLQPAEQDRVREAADTVVLAGAWDDAVERALEDVDDLAERLVDGGRWEADGAERLVEMVADCAPDAVALPA